MSRKKRWVYRRLRAGIDVWYLLDLTKRQGRKFVVLPTGLLEEILTAANWPRGGTAPMPGDEIETDEEIRDET